MSWSSFDLLAERELPGDVYLCLHHRLLKYRSQGDSLSVAEFDKLVLNHVDCVFVPADRAGAFAEWSRSYEAKELASDVEASGDEAKPVVKATVELRRAALDLFSAPESDEQAQAAIATSKAMVTEYLKKPYIIDNIGHLQRYGRGCVDHSVNVSVLSVYLGVRMGYTSQQILEHLALGGLLHDLGKAFMSSAAGEDRLIDPSTDPAFRKHPILGVEALEKAQTSFRNISAEVRMIIAQHHEFMDGTGYPLGLQGLGIYELTRVVAIANAYDNLVSESRGDTIQARQLAALERLEAEYAGKLDRKKLEKAIEIIKKSLVAN